jgi:C4-dicarboxylate-specific signal transduction histidine kinase
VALRLASRRLRDVDIAVEVEPGLPSVHAHARRVAQAVLNLLVNAADALQAHGGQGDRRIRVRARAAGEMVAIEVVDSGPGLSPEAAERLFEPFFTTKGDRGTGLGLALSRENVAASGGSIEHEPAPGGGALFRIRLRNAEASSGETEPRERLAALATRGNPTG